jgi:hypothetical protein
MKSTLTILFALSLVSFPTLHADDSAKSGTKTAEPQFVYFKGSFTKYHHGKREEALDLIYSRFWTVDQVVGRKPIPFDCLTGEWDQQLEKQEGSPEKAKALHDYHESLVIKKGDGLFKVLAADVDFPDHYYNKGGKPTYYRVTFVKYKSGKKEEANKYIMNNFRPVRLAIGRSVIPMFSVAGEWDNIVFVAMSSGLADFESDNPSEAWEEEFAKQQGGRDKAAEANGYFRGLVENTVTEITKARWKK